MARTSNPRKANQVSAMGNVMVKCPGTGREIPTGMIADPVSFRSSPVFFARVDCPLCRTQHEWFAQEAWVCEAGGNLEAEHAGRG
jgi:hypothetical protein